MSHKSTVIAYINNWRLYAAEETALSMQEDGLTNEGRHHFLLLHTFLLCACLQAHTNRARLTACEAGVFPREISQLSKIRPPTSLRSHKFIAHGRYGTTIQFSELTNDITKFKTCRWILVSVKLHGIVRGMMDNKYFF